MTDAALVLTAVTAVAALWTVRLSYRAIGLARGAADLSRESANSGEAAAKAAKETTEAARATAHEIQLGRERDRLISERDRLHDLIELVVGLQTLQQLATIDINDMRWIEKRNLLVAKIAGWEDPFPLTSAVTVAHNVQTARLQDAREELVNALRAVEMRIYIHDFR